MKFRVTYVLILAMFIVYFLSFTLKTNVESLYFNLNEFLSGRYYIIITALFLHQNFFHLILNISLLYLFGTTCEEILGIKKTIFTFLFVGIITFFISGLVYETNARFVGCSGAIFGIMTLVLFIKPIKYTVDFPFKLIFQEGREIEIGIKEEKFDLSTICLDYLIITLIVFTMIMLYGIIPIKNVAHFGHVVGVILGSAFGLIWNPKLKEYAMRASTILFYLLFIFIIFFFALYLITYFLDIKPIYSPINSFLFSTIKFISDFLQSFFK